MNLQCPQNFFNHLILLVSQTKQDGSISGGDGSEQFCGNTQHKKPLLYRHEFVRCCVILYTILTTSSTNLWRMILMIVLYKPNFDGKNSDESFFMADSHPSYRKEHRMHNEIASCSLLLEELLPSLISDITQLKKENQIRDTTLQVPSILFQDKIMSKFYNN
ncbi:hypothetical protein VNO77_29055 [Canavalia gladiata]|uniref:Uncharacterized protein n=1 Tax=Canavalia gladiata TaxID=3824 RepID=A0AAN9KW84_CANGL